MKQNNRILAESAVKRLEFAVSPAILPEVIWLVDLLMLAVAATLTVAAFEDTRTEFSRYFGYAAIIAVVYSINAWQGRLYSVGVLSRAFARTASVILALVTAVAVFLCVAFALGSWDAAHAGWALSFGGVAVAALVTGRVVSSRVLGRLGRGGVIGRTMVVLGAGPQGRRFLRRMRGVEPSVFHHLVGVYESAAGEAAGQTEIDGRPVLGDVDDLLRNLRARRFDDVVVALPWSADAEVVGLVEKLKELPVNVYLGADLVGHALAFRPAACDYSDLPLFEVVQRPISGWGAALKAVEDYGLATVAVILIAPILLLIAVAVKIDSPGPVFFMQERLGFNNQVFRIFKFRSMHHREVPESMVRQAQKGDPRVTRVGRFIRATSLDELPQLFNVLNGTMSLVGPRPHALSHNEEYGAKIRGYFARHKVKPGITGWAQVRGLRGETDTLDKMVSRIRHDVYYAENWSVWFDLRILVLTVTTVLFQKTAY